MPPKRVGKEIKIEMNKYLVLLPIAITAIAYWFLHTNYNIYFEDDSWTISNAWNLTQLGINEDLVFLEEDALGRKQLFGNQYNFIIGHYLNAVGWTKGNIFIFNSLLVFLSTFIWWKIMKYLPVSRAVRKNTALFLPLFPPLFFIAHSGRSDALVFAIISLAFLLFIKKKFIPAGFLILAAFEAHIMGLVGAFYMLSYLIYKRDEYISDKALMAKMFLGMGLGASLGIGYYLFLHQTTFSFNEMTSLISNKKDMNSPVNNYILAYFTSYDWSQHLMEAALFLSSIILFFASKAHKENKFVQIFFWVMIISTLITRRENKNYFFYLMPMLAMLYSLAYEKINKLPHFTVALSLLLSGYYISIYQKHQGFKFDGFTNFVQETTQGKDIPIVGIPDTWFACPEKTFYPIHNEKNLNHIDFDELYLVETDYLSHRNRFYDNTKAHFHQNYDCKILGEWNAYQDNVARVCHCKDVSGDPKPLISEQKLVSWKNVLKDHYFEESSL